MRLRGEDDPRLLDWIQRKKDKYTSPEMSNEMLKVMSLQVISEISTLLHGAQFYTVMADETTDVSNCEQVTICIRWVSASFEVHEEFIGLYAVRKIDANTL